MFVPSARAFAVAAFLGLSFAALGAEIAGSGGKTGELKPAARLPQPQIQTASDEAVKQLTKLTPPAGFTPELWAAEPMLGNPVAFDIDDKGRAFVAETFRYRTSTLDIRHYMFMLEDDMACRTTDDRIASIKRNFPKDWQQLEIETEEVRLIEDRNGDGKADFSSSYVAGMNTMLDGINSGVMAYDGDVWCTNIPNLWRFSGTTADGKATKRESLSFGYGVRFSFTGHDMHGLIIGPDGRLYFSFGDRGAHVVTKEGKTLAFPDEGAVFRCELDGSHLEMYYHGLRNPQELGFDNHGNLFTGDNDCDQGDRERWVYLVEGGDSGWRVGWQHPPLGKVNNMWLTERMWEPRKEGTPAYILSPIMNIPDGPSGVVHYPGTGLPAEYEDSFLVCGFKGSSAKSAISYWKVKEDGAGFSVEKSPANFIDHVQATDVAFGPDSKVYFTEWGEGWEGVGRGRILRLTNPEVEKQQAAQIAEVKTLLGEGFKQRGSEELARLLAHPDQRIRLRAQWALAEKPDGAVLFAKAAQTGSGLARLHGIWGLAHVARLAGYQAPAKETEILKPLLGLLGDPDLEVRAQVVKALGDGKVGQASDALVKALRDDSNRVRFFAAQGLGKLGKRELAGEIVALVRDNADKDEFIRHAGVQALLALGDEKTISEAARDTSRSVRLAALLVWRKQQNPAVAQFLNDSDSLIVKEAARAICDAGIDGAMPSLVKVLQTPVPDEKMMLRVINAAFRTGDAPALARYACETTQPETLRVEALTLLSTWGKPPARDRVAGVYRPLPARDAKPAAVAVEEVLPKLFHSKSPAVLQAGLDAVLALDLKASGSTVFRLIEHPDVPAKVRSQALNVLASMKDAKLGEAVRLASKDSDSGLRVTATAMLGSFDPELAAQQLSTIFPTASMADKKQIVTSLGELKSAAADQALCELLDAVQAGKLPGEVHLELMEAAAKHPAPQVKARLSAWEAAQANAGKLGRFNFALLGGNATAGEKVFTEHAIAQCTRCHKVKGSGGEAGPDLTGAAKRIDRNYILESIVDPNAKIAQGFDSVICTMKDGNIKAGIIKGETDDTLTLLMPGAPTPPETIKKADIKQRDMAPSGMPPGFGDLLSKRELRDVVEYVASLK